MSRTRLEGTGRVADVIAGLRNSHPGAFSQIAEREKLDAICMYLRMSHEEFDKLISEHAPVYRTIKGHAFETAFDVMLSRNGYLAQEVGGDSEIDRRVNGHSLQLKTCTEAGTKAGTVQYKTHKTHGAKSETESMDYYHRASHFADFLVGLVSYKPLRMLVLKCEEIPRHPKSRSHLLSPFSVKWERHPALNAFDRLGVRLKDLRCAEPKTDGEILPLTSRKLGLASGIILDTILNLQNFRIWDMSIRGFAREAIFRRLAKRMGLDIRKPDEFRRDRADKADHGILTKSGAVFLQMKGVSTNNCDFTRVDPVLATETQLTRGRVNDHPTQSRLYQAKDFDYLVLGMDPAVVHACKQAAKLRSGEWDWEFYVIPSDQLERHHIFPSRYKTLQKFTYKQLQKFRFTDSSRIFKVA